MTHGKDERNNPKRKVSKKAKGMTTFDMDGGAIIRWQRIVSPERERDLEAQRNSEDMEY